jgi:hypothetical protein
MYDSEIEKLKMVQEEKDLTKIELVELAIDKFDKLSKTKQNVALNSLDFERVKTVHFQILAPTSLVEIIDKKAEELNLKKPQFLRVILSNLLKK